MNTKGDNNNNKKMTNVRVPRLMLIIGQKGQ